MMIHGSATVRVEVAVRVKVTAVSPAPTYAEADIKASHIVNFAPGSLPAKPAEVFKGVDMMNVFIVVATGDHSVTVFDGDRLEPIHRLPSRYALHGGPKFTPDAPGAVSHRQLKVGTAVDA